jgi:P-type Cu+ transporter
MRLLKAKGIVIDEAQLQTGDEDDIVTRVYLAIDGVYRGGMSLMDAEKPSSAAAVSRLREMQIESWIISGDKLRAALAVARSVGIPFHHVHAELQPGEKADVLQREIASRSQSRSSSNSDGGIVAFAGDGINDSPALAVSPVSFAMGGGSDIAKAAADIIVINNDLSRLPDAIILSKLMNRKIRENLVWAVVYNGLMLPSAMMGLVSPTAAALAMGLSSVSVVGNSLRLRSAFNSARLSKH